MKVCTHIFNPVNIVYMFVVLYTDDATSYFDFIGLFFSC